MKRLTLALALLLAFSPLAQAADAILHMDAPGQTLYVRVFESSTGSVAAALTEGTGNGVGRYVATDATLAAAGLDGTAVYPYKVFSGTPSTSADDPLLGVGSVSWASTVAVSNPLLVASVADTGSGTYGRFFAWLNSSLSASGVFSTAALANGPSGSGTPVSATQVAESRTWQVGPDSATAGNIVTVKQNFTGTLQCEIDLNDAGDIATVSSVAITGAATPTATTLRKRGDGKAALFDVPALATTGNYTVIITVTTVDSQTIPIECRLIVR